MFYSNKRRSAYLIFRTPSAALIRGRCLFKHCTRQIYFLYIFIQRYAFYSLIFLWTDTKSRITREIHALKRPESFMITRAKISAVSIRCAALINFFVPDAALIRINTVVFVNSTWARVFDLSKGVRSNLEQRVLCPLTYDLSLPRLCFCAHHTENEYGLLKSRANCNSFMHFPRSKFLNLFLSFGSWH